MNIAAKRLLCLVILIVWSSCASTGRPFRFEDAERIELGMTQEEVVAIMGKPRSVHKDGTGELWMWIHVVVTPFSSSSESFSVKLRDGRVIYIQK